MIKTDDILAETGDGWAISDPCVTVLRPFVPILPPESDARRGVSQ